MTRIEYEKDTVEKMIHLYCRAHNHGTHLCDDCRQLLEYAHKRLDKCKFGNQKSTCRKCPVHCYKPQMREKMLAVMRFAGPRMMYHHPVSAIKHLWYEIIGVHG